jgi:hypothetical protein
MTLRSSLPASQGPSHVRLKITAKAAAEAAAEHEANLAAMEQQVADEICDETIQARALNTTKNYTPKQEEFKTWTRKMNYPTGELVTHGKLMAFLKTEVVNRKLRKKKKRAVTVLNEETGEEIQVLKWGSVRGYATAINDLYNIQKMRGMSLNCRLRQ